VIGRIERSADFERVLAAPSRARSPHFAVHHLQAAPLTRSRPAIPPLSTELSTGLTTASAGMVDDPRGQVWLGAVLPKRHARRAVTRSLLKRQIRAALSRAPHVPGGLWVVRLRAPFPREHFPSAASPALAGAARSELDTVLADAVRRAGGAERRVTGV
jgi:ribonuclease P protein component